MTGSPHLPLRWPQADDENFEDCFNVQVDHVRVNFNSFVQIVNAVGAA